MNTVIVKSHPESGLVITPSKNNPEWGTIRVEQTSFTMTNGILNKSTRVAFLRGKIADFKALDLKAEKAYPIHGKLAVRESFEPFYEGQASKVNPKTSEEITVNGLPVYRETYFTSNMDEADELITSNSLETASKEIANQ